MRAFLSYKERRHNHKRVSPRQPSRREQQEARRPQRGRAAGPRARFASGSVGPRHLVQVEAVVAVAAEADEDEVEVDGHGQVRLGLEAVEGGEVAGLDPVLRLRLVRPLGGGLELFLEGSWAP